MPARAICFQAKQMQAFKEAAPLNRKSLKALRAALSLALAAALVGVPAAGASAAETTPTPGTDVWLSVVPRPTQERISVTLPTVIAFVVNGTADEANTDAVSVKDGGLLIPNVKVAGADSGDGSYQLVTTGESALVARNYSTNVPEANADDESPPRYGIQVQLGATVITAQDEDGDPVDPAERANWVLTGTAPTTSAEDFKKFRLSLDGHAFSKRVDNDTYEMDGTITLGAAPSHQSGWTAGGVSNEPFEQELALNVEVGGTRGMYSTAENSAKAAQIIWTVRGLPLEYPLPGA